MRSKILCIFFYLRQFFGSATVGPITSSNKLPAVLLTFLWSVEHFVYPVCISCLSSIQDKFLAAWMWIQSLQQILLSCWLILVINECGSHLCECLVYLLSSTISWQHKCGSSSCNFCCFVWIACEQCSSHLYIHKCGSASCNFCCFVELFVISVVPIFFTQSVYLVWCLFVTTSLAPQTWIHYLQLPTVLSTSVFVINVVAICVSNA